MIGSIYPLCLKECKLRPCYKSLAVCAPDFCACFTSLHICAVFYLLAVIFCSIDFCDLHLCFFIRQEYSLDLIRLLHFHC